MGDILVLELLGYFGAFFRWVFIFRCKGKIDDVYRDNKTYSWILGVIFAPLLFYLVYLIDREFLHLVGT